MKICIEVIFVKLVTAIKIHGFNFHFLLHLAAQLSRTE